MTEFEIRNMDQVAPVYNMHRGILKRQLAFDNVNLSTSIFTGLYSAYDAYEEEQAVPTGLDSLSHDSGSCELPLLTPCSKAVMSQALKATFNGFTKEQRRLGIPNNPWLWNQTQVCQWLSWAVTEFSLESLNFSKFIMTGQDLCNLGKERFLELAPDFVGDILWEHLEQMMKEQEKIQDQYIDSSSHHTNSQWISNDSLSFRMEPLHCVSRVQSYPKTEMYSDLCPITQVPNLLPVKQEFQSYSCMKSMGNGYSSLNQEYGQSNMNVLLNSLNSGKLSYEYEYCSSHTQFVCFFSLN
ncbi:hypothetical protein GDO81_007019 [Engystomops pustulosus]|uniref:PNT domain-containing protein n=1 Tax=Engystomops pustulosus TaxID=76066 RepID=A0AAV7D0T5_ENGPU|nr:hypothetical protein GDO81_007019 [Engystomops pustulosus]